MSDDILYHYCSIDSFVAIMQSRSLWLSDITKSNDSAELSWFLKKFYEYSMGRINEKYFCSPQDEVDYVNARQIGQDPRESLGANHPSIIKRDKTYLIRYLTDPDNLDGMIFAFCLSECGDSLSQWRGYANDGTGICIGFRKSAIDDYLHSLPFNKCITLKEVFYETNSFNAEMQSIFDNIDSLSTDNITEPNSICMPAAACYKNPSFTEEKEWRIVFNRPSFFLEFKNCHQDGVERGFRSSGLRIIEYQKLLMGNFSNLIAEVIIGPKSRVSKYDVQTVLYYATLNKDAYKDIEIYRSESTYR